MTISNNSANVSIKTTDNQEPIKVTARFQDSVEPIRHRPIIRIEGSHIVRTSIDSGRDNPFRPDGDIYKSADPIVDYYKQAANQSRPQSANDNSALIGTSNGEKKQKRRFWRKRKFDDQGDGASRSRDETQKQQKTQKMSCLRRWLCCGCCNCGSSKKNDTSKVSKRPLSKEDEEIAKRLVEIAKQEAESQQKTKIGPLDAAFDANKEAYKEARRKFLRQQSQEEIDATRSGSLEQTNAKISCSSSNEKSAEVGSTDDAKIDKKCAKNKSQTDIVAVDIENLAGSNESIDKPPTVVAAEDDEDDEQEKEAENAEEKTLTTEATTETVEMNEDGEIKTATETTTITTTNSSKKEICDDKSGGEEKEKSVLIEEN